MKKSTLFILLTLYCFLVVYGKVDVTTFNEFKAKFKKDYSSKVHEQQSLRNFLKNYDLTKNHNAASTSWKMAINAFSDQDPTEFQQTYLGALVPDSSDLHQNSTYVSSRTFFSITPKTKDWRKKSPVTLVKNQKQCGSCWAFATTGVLELAFSLKYHQEYSFSEQNLMDCANFSAVDSSDGCKGGSVPRALDYIQHNGITYESTYPYEAVQGSCKPKNPLFFIKEQRYVGNERNLLKAVGTIGPVAVYINATGFQGYGSGIYDGQGCSNTINHAIVLVGYGREKGKNYWIAKNSWGPDWGENGYIRLARGLGICGLGTWGYYPIL